MSFKIIISVLLAGCILAQSGVRVLIMLDFELRKEYIKEVLCVNRDKPKLQCEGKCFLSAKLKNEEERQKNHTANLQTENDFIQLLVSAPQIIFRKYTNFTKSSAFFSDRYSFLFYSVVFQPPK